MNDFESAARRHRPTGLLHELWAFLRETRKWWLLPIITVLLGCGLLAVLSSTAAAPFIYTLY
jgi:hypothetical protein